MSAATKRTKLKRTVAVIPARGGSERIPRKNIRLLNGQPLISYAIGAAQQASTVDEVYVSTEDAEIAAVSESYGAQVIRRPQQFATNTASSESVLLHFADQVDFDTLVFLQCTCPLTRAQDIDDAVQLLSSDQYDSVLSVCPNSGKFMCSPFVWNADGTPANYDFRQRPRTQDVPAQYRENGALYVMHRQGLHSSKNRLHGRIGMYVMPNERSFDIDDIEDFKLIEQLMPVIEQRSPKSLAAKAHEAN